MKTTQGMASIAGVALLGLALGCGAAKSKGSTAAPRRLPVESPTGKARYLFDNRLPATFDEASAGSPLPRPEPAVILGVRMLVDFGIVLKTAPFDDNLRGFTSVPARLGGGFLVWSETRLYRAADFLGELTQVADLAVTGGARPWLSSVLLRTQAGPDCLQ